MNIQQNNHNNNINIAANSLEKPICQVVCETIRGICRTIYDLVLRLLGIRKSPVAQTTENKQSIEQPVAPAPVSVARPIHRVKVQHEQQRTIPIRVRILG